MSKALLFAGQVRPGGQLHTELLEGVTQLALAVGSTLGPRGRNVIIDRAGDTPLVTKDGQTVAQNIQLTNPVYHAAAKMVQAVAHATVQEAGDGTTTATVLAHNLFKSGLELVSGTAYTLPGPDWLEALLGEWIFRVLHLRRPVQISPVLLQRSIALAVEAVATWIKQVAVEPTEEQIAQVATISTNGNTAIGELLLKAVREVGRDGLITLEDSNSQQTFLELRTGFQFASGFTSPDFITERNRGVAILENPYIFITERVLTQGMGTVPTLHDLGPLLTFCAGLSSDGKTQIREPRPLLVVADDIQGDAAVTLSVNHLNKTIKVCAVRAPAYGELRRAMLADLALVTGGVVLKSDGGEVVSRWVSEGKGLQTGARLGQATRAVVSNSRTIIEGGINDPEDPELVSRFAASLVDQAQAIQDPLAREQMLQRAGRLTGSVAVIHVGAATEAEARALRDAVEDAVLAVRAAVAEGIVPGGGLCLFAAAQLLENSADDMPADLALGANLVAQTLRAPLRLIATNAGQNPDEIVQQVFRLAQLHKGKLSHGYNAATGKFEDMVAAGIVDPAKVVRVALQKAASIAALMLTSSCLVYFDPDAARMPASLVQGQVNR
jgi:chaperonin GroEL